MGAAPPARAPSDGGATAGTLVEADNSDPAAVARAIRRKVLALTVAKGGCYLSQALSSAEILAALYTCVLRLAPLDEPLDSAPLGGPPGPGRGTPGAPSGGRFHGRRGPDLDRLLISPAHYAAAVYAALEAVGRLAPGALAEFNEDGSSLEMIGAEHSPGFELTTGSFGQALSQSGGIALARRLRGDSGRTVVFMSDGELQSGQTWEGFQAAAFYGLDRLAVAVDVNGQQVDGLTRDVMNIEPISARIEGFGWNCAVVDGHDIDQIAEAFDRPGPLAVLAYTDPAKGVPMLEERKPHLHYVRVRNEREAAAFRALIREMEPAQQTETKQQPVPASAGAGNDTAARR